jgi:hypothetical protein
MAAESDKLTTNHNHSEAKLNRLRSLGFLDRWQSPDRAKVLPFRKSQDRGEKQRYQQKNEPVTEREFPRKYTAVEERKIKKHRKKKSKN